jgi:ubiquinone/menaquinone biosynthesis C-methylase UbiE
MMPQPLVNIIATVLTGAAVLVLLDQCRKPKWWLGRLLVWSMNVRHSRLTDWGLTHVPLEKHFTILDIGCGGGRTVTKLAAVTSDGKVHGIDYSSASVAAARSTNARWLEAGRVEIQQASVSHMPFPDGAFDVVTAVETHYYWPNLEADLREILRVLKPGGRLVIIAETYKGRRLDILYRPAMKLLRAWYLSVSEHRDLFAAAGYSEVEVFEERGKGWICAVGRRPLQSAA